MWVGFKAFASAVWGSFVPLACPLGTPTGFTAWQFAIAKTAVFLIFLVPALFAWRASSFLLYANGFAKPMRQWGIALLLAATFLPVAETLAVPIFGPFNACPYDWLVFASGTVLVLAGLYGFQMGRRYKRPLAKREGFKRYLVLAVGPLFGQAALNSPKAALASATLLAQAASIVERTVVSFIQ
jgi:hypothetical protein